ncbi:hypothetical protein AKO1_007388 [Acrasis kona]|uniref:TM2 domain-containing protein n=1 Tax=Acrasis kona TaxID=1008807 RepID=A0AAW2YRW8_9EUKA
MNEPNTTTLELDEVEIYSPFTPQQEDTKNNGEYDCDKLVTPNRDADLRLVVLLSLILSGLGHFHIGQRMKGISYVSIDLGYVFCSLTLFVLGVGFFMLPLIIIYRVFIAVDAHHMGRRIKNGRNVAQGECSNTVSEWGIKYLVTGRTFVVTDTELSKKEIASDSA